MRVRVRAVGGWAPAAPARRRGRARGYRTSQPTHRLFSPTDKPSDVNRQPPTATDHLGLLHVPHGQQEARRRRRRRRGCSGAGRPTRAPPRPRAARAGALQAALPPPALSGAAPCCVWARGDGAHSGDCRHYPRPQPDAGLMMSHADDHHHASWWWRTEEQQQQEHRGMSQGRRPRRRGGGGWWWWWWGGT